MMIHSPTNDPRAQKSLSAIGEALIELLEEKDFHDISVQEIIARAQVSHNTFYKYYRNKHDLAEQLAAAVKDGFRESMRLFFNHEYPLHDIEAKPPFFRHRRTVLALWQVNTRRCRLYQDMLDIAAGSFLEHMRANRIETEGDPHYQAQVFAGIALSSTAYYFRQNRPVPTTAALRGLKEMMAVLSREQRK